MNEAQWAITILWVFLFVYSIVGSVDFGAGFWAMVYGERKDTTAGVLANRFLSPTWKVTNVFLVLLVVALVGFFPKATWVLGAILLVPVSLVLFLLTVRSTFMIYAYSASKYGRLLTIVSGITGLLIPGLLVVVLPITLGGFVDQINGYPVLHLGRLFSTPTTYAHLFFGLATELFLSALLLADYSVEAEDRSAYAVYRRAAVTLGPTAICAAVLTTFTMAPEAQWIVRGIREQAVWFGLSLAAFAVGYSALWWKGQDGRQGRPRVSVLCIVVQYALASFAYGSAHMPYIVYPDFTVYEGFTNPAMFRSLAAGYAVGIAFLVPLFVWFWRLFMKDKRYLKQT
ncbi:cytochrome d ubiquinol oxidase subunit II [Gorillibacterium sp. sgz5001074]|uniref:cytochrome d ubiquinol oxidase subunit II n=1 Tax=Gorillibacterium sp. sgz5001074 TaxID=3446695 RepID=UPI003F66B055